MEPVEVIDSILYELERDKMSCDTVSDMVVAAIMAYHKAVVIPLQKQVEANNKSIDDMLKIMSGKRLT